MTQASGTTAYSTPRNTASPEPVEQLVEDLFRREAGRMVSTLTRVFGVEHMDLAEDVVQETLLKALQQWRFKGVPENPSGWLFRVSKNHALDILRRRATLGRKQGEIAHSEERRQAETAEEQFAVSENQIEDDQLRMMFTCCHPALSRESQVSLTLKTLGGLSVPEIARAFLSDERAVAQRLVRAKRTLREQGVEFVVPEGDLFEGRLDAVLQVLYLLFNEGYAVSAGENLIRAELCREAIDLVELLARHPRGDAPRTHALAALMLLQASRLPARVDGHGDLLLLADQDRKLWNRSMIHRGFAHLELAAQGEVVSEYHLEAGIAACHACAPDYESTDWPAVLDAYDSLARLNGSPVIAINRAVAYSRVHGPAAGIGELDKLRGEPRLADYYLLWSSLGALHAEAGNGEQAGAFYHEALKHVGSEPERRFLSRKLKEMEAPTGP
jgi:RNA polymerase sigma factor (sigma-70 family)